jgi:alpha-glucosidase
MLTHSLPGGIYIYQGEERGLPSANLPDNARQDPAFIRSGGTDKGRDECRVPMPWSSEEANYGFGLGTPWLPQPNDWAQYCVEEEANNPNSFLNLYKKSLTLRRSHPAVGGEGDITWLESMPGTIHFSREPGLEVVVNASGSAQQISVKGSSLLLESADGVSLNNGVLTIPSDTTVWLQR